MASRTLTMPRQLPPRIERWRPSRRRLSPGQWRWVGSAAGVVIAGTSWLCAATPKEYSSVWPGVVPWRSNGGSPLAASALLVAVGVSLYAWWALREAQVSVGWLRRTAVAWFAPLLVSAPLFSRDIYSYAATGLQLQVGQNPYREGVRHLASPWVSSVSRVWLDTPAPYGPLFMGLARSAAGISNGHLLVALAAFRLMAVASVAVIAWAIPAMARSLGTDPVRATWLGVLTPLAGAHLVAGAHNDALMVAGMAAAVALALRGRAGWACLALAAAMAVKVPAVVAVPFVALIVAGYRLAPRPPDGPTISWLPLVRRAVLVGVGTVAAFVVMSLVSGLGFSWVAALSTPGDSVQWTSLPTGLGMGIGALGTLIGHNVERPAVSALRTVALVALGVTLVVLWLRAVHEALDARAVVRYSGLAMVAVIVLSPAFHGWYLFWALPLLAASVRQRRWTTALAAVSTVACLSVLPGGLSLALDTSWVGVPLCFVAAWLLLREAVSWSRSFGWRELFSVAPPQ